MDRERIIEHIKAQYLDNAPLNSSHIRKKNPLVYNAARKEFGNWKSAIEAAGIDYNFIAKRIKWTKSDVIKILQELPEEDLVDKNLRRKHCGLYYACINLFNSRKDALIAAGISYEDTLMNIPWTKDRVLSAIQMYHLNDIPLNFKFINTHHTRLKKKAEKFFGSWGDAVDSAGLNYEEIKKNKGWSKPLLAEDGILYTSQTEGLIANELYLMKSEGKLINYQTQHLVTPGKKWTCDFVITLLNGAQLWLEVNGIGGNRKKADQQKEKLNHYDKANYFYYKISSPTNIRNIVDRFTSWFTIPVCNCVITSHKNPDGDALASVRALYEYMISCGKQAVIRLFGEVPKNLLWLLEGIEITKKVPDWAEMVFVLDCEPVKERIGWDIPALPVYNIDHHEFRCESNDPDNNIHVIPACSTAFLLYSRFGLKHDILSVGVYTDTLFTKKIREVLYFLDQMDIDEDKLEDYISCVNINPDKKLWDLLQCAKVHHCRNGFIIVETDENYSQDVTEAFIQILMKLNESICFIYGREKNVKLRTANPDIDLSIVAREYGGGGHPYAAMCSITGKVSEFKSKITSIQVRRVSDGYEE